MNSRRIGTWLVGAIFLLHLLLSYWGVVAYGYPVAPGDDTAAHLALVEELKTAQKYWPTAGYPWGLHYIIAGLGKLFRIDPLTVTTFLSPALLVGSALAIYFLAKRLFNGRVALITYALYALASLQPLQTATDGGLPNVAASGIALPLNLLCWVMLWRLRQKWVPALGFLLTGALIVWLHHLSTIIWLAVLVLSGSILMLRSVILASGRRRLWLGAALIFGLIILGLLYELTPLFGAARQLTQASLNLRDSASPIWESIVYGQSLSGLVFQFSVVGLATLIFSQRLGFKVDFSIKAVLLVWYLLYLIGSQLPFVLEPGRLARDLAMPAAVLAAVGLGAAWHYLKEQIVLRRIFLLAIGLIFIFSAAVKAGKLTAYEPMARFTKEDTELLTQISGSSPVGILDRASAWATIARLYPHLPRNVIVFDKPEAFTGYLRQANNCGLVSQYAPHIWLPDSAAENYVDMTVRALGYSPAVALTEPNKTWYRFCPVGHPDF